MRYSHFLCIVLVSLIGCQQNTEVDITATKNTISTQLDNFYQAWKIKDMDTITSFLTNDCLFCGTDPGEFWTKEQVLKVFAQILEDESLKLDFSIDKREIRLNADGNSAIIIEQSIMNWISQKIPIRTVTHCIKVDDDWKCDFHTLSLVPKNADLVKLDKAL